MPRLYERPPVTEVLCEFRFGATEEWDWTVPGLMYERIRDVFPVRREKSLLEMTIQTPEAQAETIRQGIARMQFLKDDESAVVQIGRHVLTVNQLRPYPGWDQFKSVVLAQLRHYGVVASPTAIESMSLRYINRIAVPGQQHELSDFFYALPGLPAELPMPITTFFTTTHLEFDEAPPTVVKQSFGSVTNGTEGSAEFVMDLEITSSGAIPVDEGEVEHWLDVAHERLELVFDHSFTERAHAELFGEQKATA